MTKSEFQPRIVGFLCNWCSYAGADLAGVSRIQYPPTLRIVRVMCSGRIHPALILEAFRNGADGVLVAGCHLGDCHYISGNYKTQNRVLMLKKVLEQLGLEPERLRLEWVSASEGDRFAKVIKDMTEEIKKLGPNPLGMERLIHAREKRNSREED
jgi:F420-non-reducing hydrogenase iron-sulfur subunit